MNRPKLIVIAGFFFLFLTFTITVPSGDAASELKPPCVDDLQACILKKVGCGGDPKLNALKNRTDKPSAGTLEKWSVSQVIDLNEESPSSWASGKERSELTELGEGTAMAVKGYLVGAHVTKTPESCNCFLKGTDNNDFHLNIVQRRAETIDDSVVIEMSPQSRPSSWHLEQLEALADQPEPPYVRVTGWLLFDSQHASFGHMPRATAWEIHPVTKFEVCLQTKAKCDAGTGWKALEDIQ